jgi:hypothetical protein
MAKSKTLVDSNGDTHLIYYCPGCKNNHSVPTQRWNWNGSIEKPTLSPSVRHFFPVIGNRPEKTICHYFIVDGVIDFCGDCEHNLRGKMELPDLPEIED